MSDCGACSPVRHFARSGILGNNLLAVHLNYLAKGDAAVLGNARVSVVHCPRSHFYFQHSPFALKRLGRAGVNLCLGTDSLATVYKKPRESVELDMFAEMRVLRARAPWLSARSIFRMATVNGARALQLSGRIGELASGAVADLIAIPLKERAGDAYEIALHHQGPVLASMIDGRWALPPAA